MTEVAERGGGEPARCSLSSRRRIWLTAVLPMALLILLMLKECRSVGCLMTPGGLSAFRAVLALAGAGMVLGAASAASNLRRSAPGGVVIFGWWLVGMTASLCLVGEMAPEVEAFILPPSRWSEYIVTFYAPGIIYALTAIAASTVGGHGVKMPTVRAFNLSAAVLAGLVLPLLGLWLSAAAHFPRAPQCRLLYIPVLLNFGLLLVGVTRSGFLNLATLFLKGASCWVAPCLFVLFLPWRPMTTLEIACAGFFMICSAALFVFQISALRRDMLLMARKHSKRTVIPTFLLGLVSVPAVFAADSVRDRMAVEEMVAYYCRSDLTQPAAEQLSALNSARAARALKLLKRRADGLETPYLGEVYNAIVFGGLSLSCDGLLRLCRDLGDHAPRLRLPLPAATDERSASGVRLKSASAASTGGGARLELEIDGKAPDGGRYVGSIHLPQGVFVTGMTLEIDGEPADGCFVERPNLRRMCPNAAAEQCRALAILRYRSANDLELLVFPVNGSASRKVSIDLIYPKGDPVTVTVDGAEVELPESCVLSNWRYVSPESLRGNNFTRSERKPELVFIVDRAVTEPEERMAKIMEDFPEAQSVRIVSGTVAAGEMTSASHPGDDISAICREYRQLYQPGGAPGFAPGKVIRGAILRYAKMNNQKTYPVFIHLTGNRPLENVSELRGFELHTPEYPYLLEAVGDSELRAIPLNGQTDPHGVPAHRETRILPESRIVPTENGAILPYDQPRQGDFAYDRALELRKRSLRLLAHPAAERESLPQLLSDARNPGQLIFQNVCVVPEPGTQRGVSPESVIASAPCRCAVGDSRGMGAWELASWMLFALLAPAVAAWRILRRRRGSV